MDRDRSVEVGQLARRLESHVGRTDVDDLELESHSRIRRTRRLTGLGSKGHAAGREVTNSVSKHSYVNNGAIC